jgi:hypothetical protein
MEMEVTAMADTPVTDAGQVDQVALDLVDEGQSDWGRMSPEEREADIDQAIAKIGSRNQEPTEDTAETPVTGDETSASDDAAAAAETAKSEGEETPPEEPDWRDEETRDFATMMGLTADDLAGFGSRIIDRKAFEAGKTAQAAQGQPATPQIGQQAGQTAPPPPGQPLGQPADPFADLTPFKLGEQFEEDAAKPLNAFMEATASTIRRLRDDVAAMRQSQQRQAVGEIRRRALAALHEVGNTELFGKPDQKPTAEQAANIEKVLDAHFIHARGLLAQGREVAPTRAFLKAAVNLVFGDHLLKQQQRQQAEKLRKQQARITGAGSGKVLPKPPPPDETVQQAAQRIAADPEVQAIFDQMAAETTG